MTIRTLVLSGGGGRGAFQAGVYKYLMEADKAEVDEAHRGPWSPEIVVGTSIGAVNGAAIAQGMSAEEMVTFWQNARESDIEGLPPGMNIHNIALRLRVSGLTDSKMEKILFSSKRISSLLRRKS